MKGSRIIMDTTAAPHLNPVEARVLGCLIEKKALTPEVYPLTLNALQLAANQKTSREPVMSLEPAEIGRALASLEQKGLVGRVHGSRVERYEHRVAQSLGLANAQAVLLALMLLRGPQTLNELMTRSERMAMLNSTEAVHEQLDLLIGHKPPLAVHLDRAPGQREERFAHLLSGEVHLPVVPFATVGKAPTPSTIADLEERIRRLEEQVAEISERLQATGA